MSREIFSNNLVRSSASGKLVSSRIWQALARVAAALSRSFRERRRAFLSALIAALNRSRNKASNTSRASSCAVASRQCTNATSIASRRGFGKRRIALTLAVLAYLAKAARRLIGMCAVGSLMPNSRTDCNLSKACTNDGPLILTGPVRKRSSSELRLPSGITNRFSSLACCSLLMPRPRDRHSRFSTRLRRLAM